MTISFDTRWNWSSRIRTPPSWSAPKPVANTTQPLTVAVRADGTVAVDGAQVDDAQLKLKADEAKAVDANLTVVLQVEEGAKVEVVQHVTDVIKAEGIVSIISHPPEPTGRQPPASAVPCQCPAPAPLTPPCPSLRFAIPEERNISVGGACLDQPAQSRREASAPRAPGR